jgi:hypothetical protein
MDKVYIKDAHPRARAEHSNPFSNNPTSTFFTCHMMDS